MILLAILGLILGGMLVLLAVAIFNAIARVAEAIEAQNDHYRIGEEELEEVARS